MGRVAQKLVTEWMGCHPRPCGHCTGSVVTARSALKEAWDWTADETDTVGIFSWTTRGGWRITERHVLRAPAINLDFIGISFGPANRHVLTGGSDGGGAGSGPEGHWRPPTHSNIQNRMLAGLVSHKGRGGGVGGVCAGRGPAGTQNLWVCDAPRGAIQGRGLGLEGRDGGVSHPF